MSTNSALPWKPTDGRSPAANGLSRRRFLQAGAAAGGGLLLACALPFAKGEAEAAEADVFRTQRVHPHRSRREDCPDHALRRDGPGHLYVHPELIAEELEVDLKQVRLEAAPANEKLYANPLLGVQATGNSNAIRGAWQPLRQAGATRGPCSWRRRQNAGMSIRHPVVRKAAR